MMVFADTSAFYAYLDADDRNHQAMRRAWEASVEGEDSIITSNYVIVETLALCQHRLGLSSARHFAVEVVPALRVHWVGQELHEAAVTAVLAAGRRGLSLVDGTSFEIMWRYGVRHAFAFDRHFSEQGFECLP